jgi:hypothetical protein
MRVQALRMADATAPPAWTDRNDHDPGVTLLEVLAYTLGALAFVAVSAALVRSRRRAGAPDPA